MTECSKKEGSMNGLLDLNGKLHQCEPYGHMELAKTIVSGMGVPVATGYEAEDYLQKQGWLVVRTRDIYGLTGYYIGEGKERYHLTAPQKDWLNSEYANMLEECQKSVDRLFAMDK